MNKLIEYLLSIGYLGYKKENEKLIKCSNLEFSTSVHGGLIRYYIKGNDIFEFGLHEHNKPPTLISPRPIVVVKDGTNIWAGQDDEINILLSKYSGEEMYNLIKSKERIYFKDKQII